MLPRTKSITTRDTGPSVVIRLSVALDSDYVDVDVDKNMFGSIYSISSAGILVTWRGLDCDALELDDDEAIREYVE